VLKKAEAPGTGYPDGRLSTKQVQKVIEKVSPNHADLVEVAPVLDRENKTLENAGNILGKLAENVN